MFCPRCGSQLKQEAYFCTKCGFKLKDRSQSDQPMEPVVEQDPTKPVAEQDPTEPAKKQNPSNGQSPNTRQKPSNEQLPVTEKQEKQEGKQRRSPIRQLDRKGFLSLVLSAATAVCMFMPWIFVPRIALFIQGNFYLTGFNPILLLDAAYQYKSLTPHWDYRGTGALTVIFALLWIVSLVFLAISIYKTYKGKTSKSTLVSAVLIALFFLLDLKIAYNYGFLTASIPVTLGPGSYLSLMCALGATGTSIASKKKAK